MCKAMGEYHDDGDDKNKNENNNTAEESRLSGDQQTQNEASRKEHRS